MLLVNRRSLSDFIALRTQAVTNSYLLLENESFRLAKMYHCYNTQNIQDITVICPLFFQGRAALSYPQKIILKAKGNSNTRSYIFKNNKTQSLRQCPSTLYRKICPKILTEQFYKNYHLWRKKLHMNRTIVRDRINMQVSYSPSGIYKI